MRIISYNVNGIRAAIKKGLIDWLKTNPADVICLQEVKAHRADIDIAAIEALGFHTHWFCAQKKGYSGVAVFSKIKPDKVTYGNGHSASDDEGRVIQLDFGDIRLINAYFPSGTSGNERQAFKYVWLDEFFTYLNKLKKKYPKIVLVQKLKRNMTNQKRRFKELWNPMLILKIKKNSLEKSKQP